MNKKILLTKDDIKSTTKSDIKKSTSGGKTKKDILVSNKKEVDKKEADKIDDVEKVRQSLKFPISDDTLDSLEAKTETLASAKNLSDKIKSHGTLKETIEIIGKEIDDMVAIIDKIDPDAVTEELVQDASQDDGIDIADDIVNLEKVLAGLKEEEVLQIKIMYLEKLTNMVKRCKIKCDPSKMRIAKCN